MAVDPRWRENQQVAVAADGTGDDLVPALARIIETGNWREFVHPMQGLKQYDTFPDYCRDFVKMTPEMVEALLDKSHAKAAARQVRRYIRGEIAPAGGVSVTNPQKRQDAGAIVARLKRDDPDLAQQVVDGQISPNAAAVMAGIRKPYARFRTDDAALAVAALLKHFTPDQLSKALREETK